MKLTVRWLVDKVSVSKCLNSLKGGRMFEFTHTGLQLSTPFMNLILKRFMYSSLSVKEQFHVLFSESNRKRKKMVKITNSIL